jgi:hypothetical protein
MSCGIDGTVEKLIDLLVENHSPDLIAFLLEREGFLDYNIRQSISDDPAESWLPELKEALYHLYAQFSPYEATRRVADRVKLVEIVNQLGESVSGLGQVEPNEPFDDVIEKTFYGLGVPIYQKPALLHGQRSTLSNLQEIQQELISLKKGERPKDLGALQGFTVTVWASVEQLLKLTIRFYVRHFATFSRITRQLQDAFEEAAEKKSLGPLLHGFADVESIFKIGETERERQERENQRKRSIKEAEEKAENKILALQNKQDRYRRLGRLEDILEIEDQIEALEKDLETCKDQQKEEEERIRQEKGARASELREECCRDFGRSSPFEGFVGIEGRQKISKRYRNEYAHLTFAEIYRRHGIEGALDAVEMAIRLVNDLATKGIVPETIVLTGLGQDCYGRELIYFVRESNVATDGYVSLGQIEAMFKEHSFYSPFATCLMHIREDKDSICNPVIYYLDEVMA